MNLGIQIPRMSYTERIGMENPTECTIVLQDSPTFGFYMFFTDKWIELNDHDFIHMSKAVKTDEEFTQLYESMDFLMKTIETHGNRQEEMFWSLKNLSTRTGRLENVFMIRDHKFEIVITVCLIVLKAVKAIDLNWIWVFSPLVAGVLFTAATVSIVSRSQKKQNV